MTTAYNSTPSEALQEAFQLANACVMATQSMRYVAGAMSDMQSPTLLEEYHAVSRAYNAAVKATHAALAALHNDDIEAAQRAVQDAEDAKQQAEAASRIIFEAYIAQVRRTKEGPYKLHSEHGTVGVFGPISIVPADSRHGEFFYLDMIYPGDPTLDIPF